MIIFRTTEFARKPRTGQGKPYPLAAAAKYDQYRAQYAAEFHLKGAMTALVVCTVCCCCCLLLLLAQKANDRIYVTTSGLLGIVHST